MKSEEFAPQGVLSQKFQWVESVLPPLESLAFKYNADKAIQTQGGPGHGYTPYYELHFESSRDEELKIMEIGVASGPSIQMWLEYFPKAKVFGVDRVTCTNDWNTPSTKAHDRYTFVGGDQSDPTMWKCLTADHGGSWDIIIDDGGHCNNEIIISFNALWPLLKPGGLYCIEDLFVSYTPGSVHVKAGFPNHMDWLRGLVDQMNKSEKDIDSIYFAKELAIIRKTSEERPKHYQHP